MAFFKKLGRGIKGAYQALGSDEYEVKNVKAKCIHCGHKNFERGKAQLNTAGMTFVGLDWVNESAYLLFCKNCSYIMWFAEPPVKEV